MVDRKPAPRDEQSGFFGRWSRRKIDARQGLPPAEPAPDAAVPTERRLAPELAVAPSESLDPVAQRPEAPSLPTLADVQSLSSESDFAPFMARGVAPGVRNAAMKKLFADPHYNVMDGLDIYIDDYTKTIPLTQAVLRSMTSARFLGLFDAVDEEKGALEAAQAAAAPAGPEPEHREDADNPAAQSVAESDGRGARPLDRGDRADT